MSKLVCSTILKDFTFHATVNSNAITSCAIAPAKNVFIQSTFLQWQLIPLYKAVHILSLINTLHNPPSHLYNLPSTECTTAITLQLVTLSFLQIHSSKFTPHKHNAAIAMHINLMVNALSLHSTITANALVILLIFDQASSIPALDPNSNMMAIDPYLMSKKELVKEVERCKPRKMKIELLVISQQHIIVGQHAQLVIQNEQQISTNQ